MPAHSPELAFLNKGTIMNDANEMMTDMVNALEPLHHEDLVDLSDQSGVSLSTLYYWKYGVIEYPRLCNFVAVAEALGFRITMR